MSPATAAPGTASAPLFGRRVLLPRAKPGDAIAAALASAGAEVACVGVTRAVPGPLAPRELAAAQLAAGHYAWVVLTSARTLDFFDLGSLSGREKTPSHAKAADAALSPGDTGRPSDAPMHTGLAVVGAGTAQALREQLGREPDLIAAGSGAALLELPQLSRGPGPAAGASGRRLLLPGSALSSPVLREGLATAGWQVDTVAAYTMEPVRAAELPEGFTAEWAGGGFDAVVLVAGSSTRALLEVAGPPPPATRVVAIGAPTATAARAAGLRVDAVAAAPTPAGVRDAIVTTLPDPPH
ncbi:uroporphyrinogen-III synthase [Actinomyces procaprae]|uniref:uroporphyrinogen-III synthase n=1 Tax=Actinomyces procaprae TaxID=2560010 RepID=UPI0010A2933D|nr:uroporphyrinogen-III synthase [Actinomyces procaprae]